MIDNEGFPTISKGLKYIMNHHFWLLIVNVLNAKIQILISNNYYTDYGLTLYNPILKMQHYNQ